MSETLPAVRACCSGGCARSWRSRWSRRIVLTGSSAGSPATWWRRFAPSMCCAPTASSNSRDRRPQPRGRASHATEDGQGLVGTIAASAQPLNLSDAQSHPAFRTGRKRAKKSTIPSSACRSCSDRALARRSRRAEQGEPQLSRGRAGGARDRRHGACGDGGAPAGSRSHQARPRTRPDASGHRRRRYLY